MLFGKRKLSLDDILNGIDALSDEDKERLRWELGGSEQPPEETPAEQPAEAPTEEPATEETPANEPAEPAEEEPSAEEAEEPAPEENPTEEPTEQPTEEPVEEVDKAEGEADELADIRAEMAEMKKTLEALAARLDADAENKTEEEPTEPFGVAAGATGNEAPKESDLERAKKKYWNI